MTSKLKLLLPLGQVMIAIALGVWSYFQYENTVRGGISYDYVPSAGLVLHVLNLPAALILSLVTRNASLQIGLQHSVPLFIVYLFLIAALWLAIGWRLAVGASVSAEGMPLRRGVGVVAVLIALVVAALGVLSFQGPLSLLVPIFAFIWAITLVVLFRCWFPWVRRAA